MSKFNSVLPDSLLLIEPALIPILLIFEVESFFILSVKLKTEKFN